MTAKIGSGTLAALTTAGSGGAARPQDRRAYPGRCHLREMPKDKLLSRKKKIDKEDRAPPQR